MTDTTVRTLRIIAGAASSVGAMGSAIAPSLCPCLARLSRQAGHDSP